MLRRPLLIASTMLLSTSAFAFNINDLSDNDRVLFRQEVRDYLMQNPQVILEAVASLERSQAEQDAQTDLDLVSQNAAAIFDDGYSYVGGNPHGDITLVEFMDYRCGYCKKAFQDVEKLITKDGNIRFIVKEFPILGDQSVLASRFVIAARLEAGDEAYKAIHDGLMTLRGDLNLRALRRLASTLGYDAGAIEARMDDSAVTQELAATRALAQKLKITGTPTFILEDEMLRGYLPFEALRERVKDKREL